MKSCSISGFFINRDYDPTLVDEAIERVLKQSARNQNSQSSDHHLGKPLPTTLVIYLPSDQPIIPVKN